MDVIYDNFGCVHTGNPVEKPASYERVTGKSAIAIARRCGYAVSAVGSELKALKKYGMFLADNGSDWFISGAPDSRWDDDLLSTISNVKGSDFEVVEMGEIVTE